MKSGIYKILNFTSNKFYIGSAKNLNYRWARHIKELISNSHKNPYLQNAWNKQWGQHFEFIVLEYCNVENLLEREQWWLDFTQSYNSKIGYNICRIAGSMLGTKQTKEHIEKRIKSRKTFIHTEETKEKIRQSLIGRKLSVQACLKMGIARKGKQFRLGTKTSEETKIKLSIAGKGRIFSEDHKRRISESKKGKSRSEETKDKLRKAALKQWKNFRNSSKEELNG